MFAKRSALNNKIVQQSNGKETKTKNATLPFLIGMRVSLQRVILKVVKIYAILDQKGASIMSILQNKSVNKNVEPLYNRWHTSQKTNSTIIITVASRNVKLHLKLIAAPDTLTVQILEDMIQRISVSKLAWKKKTKLNTWIAKELAVVRWNYKNSVTRKLNKVSGTTVIKNAMLILLAAITYAEQQLVSRDTPQITTKQSGCFLVNWSANLKLTKFQPNSKLNKRKKNVQLWMRKLKQGEIYNNALIICSSRDANNSSILKATHRMDALVVKTIIALQEASQV